MRALSQARLLDVWEIGQQQRPVGRALALLAAACPEVPPARLAELSIGQRDAGLLTLREWAFGSRIAGLTRCPACDERLDFELSVDDIRTPHEPPAVQAVAVEVEDGAWRAQVRLPTSGDLLALDRHDGTSARQILLEHCLLSAEEAGEARTGAQLPAALVEAIDQALSQADPQADVELALACPACDHSWGAAFDIVSFFWSEISAWAARTLQEIHILASAYGWREREILALSPRRRQAYLELIQT